MGDTVGGTYTGPVVGVGNIEVTKETDVTVLRSKRVQETLKRADKDREANAKAAQAGRDARFEEAKKQAQAMAASIKEMQKAFDITPEEAPETFTVTVA